MDEAAFQAVVVGGGIGGSAAALRAAQHGLRAVWIRGNAETSKASRGRYVFNVDNMIGVHPRIVLRKLGAILAGPEHAQARALLENAHLHISTEDIVANVVERVRGEASHHVTIVDEAAVRVARDGDVFTIETDQGRKVRGEAVVLSTGVMDRQPNIKVTLPSGKVLDDIHWIFPFANNETLLYCVLCEGHLTRDTPTVVLGSRESAAQVALMLHERYGSRITLLTNGEPLKAADETQRLLTAYGIEVASPRVAQILDGETRPKGASLRGFRLEDGTVVEARFAMVAMGLYRVYNDLARQLGTELDPADDGPDDVRHVLVDEATSETSVRNVFAIGDMSRRRGGGQSMKQIYTAQEFAVRAINAIDRRVRRERRRIVLSGLAVTP